MPVRPRCAARFSTRGRRRFRWSDVRRASPMPSPGARSTWVPAVRFPVDRRRRLALRTPGAVLPRSPATRTRRATTTERAGFALTAYGRCVGAVGRAGGAGERGLAESIDAFVRSDHVARARVQMVRATSAFVRRVPHDWGQRTMAPIWRTRARLYDLRLWTRENATRFGTPRAAVLSNGVIHNFRAFWADAPALGRRTTSRATDDVYMNEKWALVDVTPTAGHQWASLWDLPWGNKAIWAESSRSRPRAKFKFDLNQPRQSGRQATMHELTAFVLAQQIV